MKRIISFCLLTAMVLSFVIPAYAGGVMVHEETIILENGDYIEIVVTESLGRSTKSGSKSYTYYSSGSAKWKGVLNAYYTYDGSSSSCTSASCSVAIYDSAYSVANKYTVRSGNMGTASITMNRTVNGSIHNDGTYKISLSCDKNGNLS